MNAEYAVDSKDRADQRVIFIDLKNRFPADPIFDKVFRFLDIDRKNVVVFTQVAGDLKCFAEFLTDYSGAFSRAILLFSNDGDISVPGDLNRLGLPIPWEAFTIFEDGRFVRILERDNEIVARSLEEWAKWENTLA